jgi:general secretion pathway protein K
MGRWSLSQPTYRRDHGFALIIVLWTLVLIGFIVAHLTANGRTEIQIAGNLVANSKAQAAADGAIYEAIFNQLDPKPEQRWPVDGSVRPLEIGNIRVAIKLEDEGSWINPSLASPPLVEALLRVTGNDAETARSLTDAISEWVGTATSPRPQETVVAEYRAAGLDYGPPGAPLETLGELNRVNGMTPAIYAAIRPHLTLFGPPSPNPATADPVVAAALTLSLSAAPGQLATPVNQPAAELLTLRITALASGPGNARVVRTGVVRIGAALPQGYTMLAWGSGLESDLAVDPRALPLSR